MRDKTDYIIVHCAATTPDMDIGFVDIDRWHKNKKPPWDGCGYHFVIRRNGLIEIGRNINAIGAHARGYNNRSIGICLAGGIDKNKNPEDNFTQVQKEALDSLINTLQRIYPDAKVIGHHDINLKKSCPCFDVRKRYKF